MGQRRRARLIRLIRSLLLYNNPRQRRQLSTPPADQFRRRNARSAD